MVRLSTPVGKHTANQLHLPQLFIAEEGALTCVQRGWALLGDVIPRDHLTSDVLHAPLMFFCESIIYCIISREGISGMICL